MKKQRNLNVRKRKIAQINSAHKIKGGVIPVDTDATPTIRATNSLVPSIFCKIDKGD